MTETRTRPVTEQEAKSADYDWWRNAVSGKCGPIHEGHPQCGYYKRRAFSRGPYVPGAIWRGEDGTLRAENNGSPQDPDDAWLWLAKHPISYEAYLEMKNSPASLADPLSTPPMF